MMKDFVNPLVLLAVVVLVACRIGAEDEGVADSMLLWALALCATAFIVDGALVVARAVTHRRVLMPVVWAAVFLILGSCLLATAKDDTRGAEEEWAAFRALNKARLAGGDAGARDESGDNLLTLAASLGKVRVVKELLQEREAISPNDIQEAAMRAAENGREEALGLLLDAGGNPSCVYLGTTLLCSAAQNGRKGAVRLLLERGAEVNQADAEGVTPLIHAVIAESVPVVRLLRRHGADVSLKDAEGRDAESYARSAEIRELLNQPQP